MPELPTPQPVESVEEFGRAWIAAWNAHDLDRIMGHYHDDVVFTSPLIVAASDRTARSAPALRSYFQGALARNPDLRFELLGAFAGVDSTTVLYRTHRGWVGAEVMVRADGAVLRGAAHYGQLSG